MVLKFCLVQNLLYIVVNLLKVVPPSGVLREGLVLVSCLKMKEVEMFHSSMSSVSSTHHHALSMVLSMSSVKDVEVNQSMDLYMLAHTSYHFSM